ncbi:MAG: hypothetical protein U0989_19195 [Azonexus sp.]|nr:hypothetical protein [Azonexus sp.]
MSLIYLSSIRNIVMKDGFKVQASEDVLAAETTFRAGLEMNKRLATIRQHELMPS